MPAPRKPEGDKLHQIKVHVPLKELEIYTRPVIEELIAQHRKGGIIVRPKVDYTTNEHLIIDVVIGAYRKSHNQINFISRLKTLK